MSYARDQANVVHVACRGASAPGARAAADEQDRRRRGLGDRRRAPARGLRPPALGEPDRRAGPRPRSRGARPPFARSTSDRLGLRSRRAAARRATRSRARRLASPPPFAAPPAPSSFSGASCADAIQARELERGPVVLAAAERHHHRVLGVDRRHALPLDEHGDVARRLLEDLADRAARDAVAEQRPAAVEQHEVDLLLGGEAHVVLPGQDRREGDRARGDAALGQRGAPLAQLAGWPSARRRWSRSAPVTKRSGTTTCGDDELARRRRPARAARRAPAARRGSAGPAARRGSTRAARPSDGIRRRAARAAQLLLDRLARARRRGSIRRRTGPAMNVVTSAITTSIVNSCGEITPRSRPMLSTISSVRPRVFISAPIAAESRRLKPP